MPPHYHNSIEQIMKCCMSKIINIAKCAETNETVSVKC